NSQARQWNIHERDVATTHLGQIESWPTGAGPYVQETFARSQFQKHGNPLCLDESGPAIGSIVATTYMAFDRQHDRRLCSWMELFVPSSLGLFFWATCHRASCQALRSNLRSECARHSGRGATIAQHFIGQIWR